LVESHTSHYRRSFTFQSHHRKEQWGDLQQQWYNVKRSKSNYLHHKNSKSWRQSGPKCWQLPASRFMVVC
jgi:hypothetical protein